MAKISLLYYQLTDPEGMDSMSYHVSMSQFEKANIIMAMAAKVNHGDIDAACKRIGFQAMQIKIYGCNGDSILKCTILPRWHRDAKYWETNQINRMMLDYNVANAIKRIDNCLRAYERNQKFKKNLVVG